MNESMNFGNIGFNSVASNNTENNFEVKAPTTTTGQNITEENSGIDFPKSSVAKIDESKEDNFSSIEFGPLPKHCLHLVDLLYIHLFVMTLTIVVRRYYKKYL